MAETLTMVPNLKSLLVSSKSTEVEYPGLQGFIISINFLSREVLVNIRKKATKISYKKHQPIEELDDKLFLQLYVDACIKGWKGLTLSYLEKLAPVDLSGQDPKAELAYNSDNALFLMQNSSDFDSFISDTVTELSNFTKASALS